MRRVLLVAVLLPLTACPPPCGQVCRKVLFDCELDTERVALDECELSCETQGALYQVWEDEHLQDLFDDHRRCVGRSSCDELARGVCYEGYEELFVFDPDKDLPEPADLTVHGAGFGVVDGTAVVGALLGDGGAAPPVPVTTATSGGSFDLRFPGALEAGRSYTVDLFLDANGDGACSGAEALVAWRIPVFQDVGLGDRTVTTGLAAETDPAACATFAP
jgi:hypothetical protein